MDQIFNDPIVKHFFQSIAESDKKSTLKELVLLGIHAVSSKVHESSCRRCNSHCGCCGCTKIHKNWQAQAVNSAAGCCAKETANFNNNNVALQLQQIRNRIDQLSSNCQQNNWKNPSTNIQNPPTSKPRGHSKQIQQATHNESQANSKHFRHHLDDSQVRKALVNPYAKISPIKNDKKKKSLQKNHLLQKQRDAQALKNNRETIQHIQETGDGTSSAINNVRTSNNVEKDSNKKMKRTALGTVNEEYNRQTSERNQGSRNRSYGDTKSKIKSLIQKDKERNKKMANSKKSQYSKAKYCQFQYSDQSQIESNNNLATESECPVHSRKKQDDLSEEDSSLQVENSHERTRQVDKQRMSSQSYKIENKNKEKWMQYKENRRKLKKNSYEAKIQEKSQEQSESVREESHQQKGAIVHEEDEVSQSSSFSKFSISSGRQNGKIYGLRK